MEQAGASSCSVVTKRVVLLATVCVNIEAPSGKLLTVRALMDTASDSSFVSEWVVQTLQLRKTIVNVPVTGVHGCETGVSTSAVNLRILSSFDPRFELKVQALVLRKLTSLIPSNYVQREHWPHLTDITLADPDFAIPSKIDLILGADVCGPLFLDGFRQGPAGSPNARLTPFGWVLLGPVECSSEDCLVKNSVTLMHIEAYNNLTAEMQRFWEVEEVPSESPMSEEDTRCENHFKETHTRNSDGRYVVLKLIGGLRLEKVPAVFAWTDSKVTLSWIRGHASKWKPFVAHRVSEIQSALPMVSWRYVCTAHNPADAATRGIDPDELIRHPLWWNGPHWLAKEETAWSREPTVSDGSENVELKGAEKLTCHVAQANKDRARLGHITAEERAAALDCLIKCSQSRYFGLEFDCFKSSKPLPKSSPLLPLQPFLDEKGIIRVGGRLKNAVLSYDERHPIIIAKQCHLALLLARHAHAATLHGGQQLTRCHLAQKFISRRGRCLKLFSDNATNFRGADRELRSLFKAASSFYEKASGDLSTCGTDWIFNPPYAPHFGGLWEAGVKSVKHHLRRVIGDQKMTFEEM
ncbi:uncharacterized protein LOC124170373 [Ischnura elegans]|uniref:uncharacterized protein LOC124170373 n=1 Tax=Ischnura elegans TaxID=197161 RepID=UPI001ED882E7|nr:uncharacterized protein LOC124170373 [Ischnura elegans]